MRIANINQNCTFKALYISDEKDDVIKRVVVPRKDFLEKMAKDRNIFISRDNAEVTRGIDYVCTRPTIRVNISPVYGTENCKISLAKDYKTVMGTSFIYLPSTKNEKENKFETTVQKFISLIG